MEMTKVKSKVASTASKVSAAVAPIGIACGSLASRMMVFCNGDGGGSGSKVASVDATSLISTIFKFMGTGASILGVFIAVLGLIGWATAHSEGDGPAQSKAVGKIAGGVILIAVGLLVGSGAFDSMVKI